MGLDFNRLQHRLSTDARFKNRAKKIVIIGALGLILILILVVVLVIMFFSAIAGFVLTHVPALFSMVFDHGREFAATFLVQDLNALLQPITNAPYVAEMQSLIGQYAEQLRTNPAIDFQNFQDFISTVKTSLTDSQISSAELDMARQFLAQ